MYTSRTHEAPEVPLHRHLYTRAWCAFRPCSIWSCLAQVRCLRTLACCHAHLARVAKRTLRVSQLMGKLAKHAASDAKAPAEHAASDGSRQKRARELNDFFRGSYVSQRALSSTLKRVREQGLPASSSRRTLQRARGTGANEETSYGPCVIDAELPLVKGAYKIALINPFAMLKRLFEECDAFREVILAAHARRRSTLERPWDLVLYFDGVSPSNPLEKGTDMRGMECVYWTIVQMQRMSHEDFWLTAAACREVLIHKELEGGMSRFMGLVLALFLGMCATSSGQACCCGWKARKTISRKSAYS